MPSLSSSSAVDDRLRRLIDQRAARAALPAPSPHFADSPSVYSPSIAFFSPPTSVSHSSMHSSATDSSMLDLDDDTRTSTCLISNETAQEDHSDDDDGDDGDDSDLHHRMSLLGPKMRFHSRAPWETGEDALPEEDESSSQAPNGFSEPSSSRMPNIEGLKNAFLFGGPKSGRGSEDSDPYRSHGKYKRSFESASTYASQYTHSLNQSLAQPEKPSSTLPPSPHSMFRYKFSRSNNTPPITPTATSPASGNSPSADQLRFCAESPVPWISAERRPSASTLPLPSERGDSVHPYANPDLVITSAEDPLPLPSNLAEYALSSGSRSEARISFIKPNGVESSKSSNTITLSPTTSSSSSFRDNNQERPLRSKTSNIQPKDISSPISVQNSSLSDLQNRDTKLSDSSILSGWYNSATPSFNLISLEEARAQRTRSGTASAAVQSQGPESLVRAEPLSESPKNVSNRPAATTARARSTSAGIRPKILADLPFSSDSQRSPSSNGNSTTKPTLKHRKSGFMRIFHSKERDKERPPTPPPPPPPPPPLPSAVDDHVANAQPRPSDLSKLSIRVPVPPVNPTDAPVVSFAANNSNGHLSPAASPRKSSPITRRIISSALSISTASSPSHSSRFPSSASSDQQFSSLATSPSVFSDSDKVPQSAPANVADFPSLHLRPVSTLFSAHFQEHLTGKDSESDEAQSPASSANRPITPGGGSFSRSDPYGLGSAVLSSDDPASVIHTLQNQISSVRKAWQLEIWNLEGQIKDLKTQLEGMRMDEQNYCDVCGRGRRSTDIQVHYGVVNRPRARTGTTARFAGASS